MSDVDIRVRFARTPLGPVGLDADGHVALDLNRRTARHLAENAANALVLLTGTGGLLNEDTGASR